MWISLLVLASLFSWCASSVEIVNKLKDYRTYYFVKPIPPFEGQLFIVVDKPKLHLRERYILLKDASNAPNLITKGDLKRVQSEDYSGKEAPFALFDPSSSPEKTGLTQQMQVRIKELFPEGDVYFLVVRKTNHFRVMEVVPIGSRFNENLLRKDKVERMGFYSFADVIRNEAGLLEFPRVVHTRAYSSLVGIISPWDEDFSILNFTLPPDLEGSALFALRGPVGPVDEIGMQFYEDYFSGLLTAIENSRDPADPKVVLEALLDKQGDDPLPPGLQQYFEFVGKLIGWNKDGQREYSEEIIIRVPIKKALDGTVDLSVESLALGLKLHLKGGFTGRRDATNNPQLLHLSFEGRSDYWEKSQFTNEIYLSATSKKVLTTTSGEVAILGPIKVSIRSSNLNPSGILGGFKGIKSISSISFEFSDSLVPSPLTGIQKMRLVSASGSCDRLLRDAN